jgi:hypothetical protein
MFSALALEADMSERSHHFRVVPRGTVVRRSKEHRYSITSSARCWKNKGHKECTAAKRSGLIGAI